MEEAVTLAESMDARGHGRGRRTRYRPERWTPSSAFVVAAATVAAAAFLAASWGGAGGLHPSTAPLEWPSVDAGLVALIALLAVPGFVPRREGGAR
jgi:energy-coupling factor transport system permease protein